MITGTFKLKDGTELRINDASVMCTIEGTQYPLSDVLDALQSADSYYYMPLYFDASTTERHSFVPPEAKSVKLVSLEADGSGTSGLSITMTHDIGTATSITLAESAADCSSYASRGVVFALEGMSDQTEVAAMVLFTDGVDG